MLIAERTTTSSRAAAATEYCPASAAEAAAAALARGGLLGAALGWLLSDHAGAPTIELNLSHAHQIPNPM